MASILRGVVVGCNHEAFVIADPSAKLHINFEAVEKVSSAHAGLVELKLSTGVSVLIVEVPERQLSSETSAHYRETVGLRKVV